MKYFSMMIFLGMMTLASFWVLQRYEDNQKRQVSSQKPHDLAIAYGVFAQYFDRNQQLQYELKSTQLSELSHQRGSKIHNPIFFAYDKQHEHMWSGQSNTASISHDRNHVVLEGAVKVVQFPNGPQPMHVIGQEVNYYALKQELSSQLPVIIDNGTIRQTSNKLLVTLKDKHVYFDEAVKATYQTSMPPTAQ